MANPGRPDAVGRVLGTALQLGDSDDQARAMRRAFDQVGQMTPTEPAIGLDEVRVFPAMAIRIGAPASNAGDHQVLLLSGMVPEGEPVRRP
jgi:hypothetical protein